MKHTNYKSFKLFTQLRTGHNHLNAQRKWGNNKLCISKGCNDLETLIHFLFECKHNEKERIQLLQEIQDIYEEEIDLKLLDNEEKLKWYLFPYNKLILNKDKMKNKEYKKIIFEKRLQIIKLITNFCKTSGRF
eukprot:187751_1